jgi:chitodextrinase
MTHLFYVYSPDEGNTWYKANGQQITTFPITKATGDLVYKRYPTGYVYPAASTEQVFGNASDLLLDIDGKPIVIQGVAATNQNLFFKWNGTSWVDVTSTYTFDNIRLYTNLIRKETYNFGAGQSFKMSRDYMKTWINSVSLTNTCDWYTIIDKYYLQKTGNVRYYARNTTNNTAAVATMQTALADAVAPAAPTSLSASDKTQSTFTLSWTPSPELDVCAYQIYQDNSLIATTGNAYYDFTGLTPLQNYSITVKAKDVSGNLSPFSNTLSVTMLSNDTQKPTTPNGLTASSIATNSFTLNWSGISTDNVGVTGYEAFSDGISIGSSVGIGNSMNITGLTEGTIYSVTLKAKDQPGNYSDASASITVKTLSNGLIVYEPFNYTIGTISNNPDGNLNLGNGLPATNAIGVPAGIGTGLRGIYGVDCSIVSGLSYTGLQTNGLAAKITNADWGTGVNFYRSMTTDPYLSYRVGAVNTANFGVNGQTLYVSFIAQTSSATSASFRICIAGGRNVFIENTATKWSLNENSSGSVASTATLELNTPTLLVVKYQFVTGGGDVISLYKNPTIGQPLGTPNATLTIASDFPGISGFTTRPAVANAMTIDEFRMGTSSDNVMPASLTTSISADKISDIKCYSTNKQIVINLPASQGNNSISIIDARGAVIKLFQNTDPQVCITVPNAGI